MGIYSHINNVGGFFFLYIFPNIYFSETLIMTILTSVSWLPHWSFDIHFSSNWHIFMCFLAIFMSSLDKFLLISSAQFLIGLFFLILSCMWFLHLLEINPLSVASFANIFSHSESCIFILLMVSFALQKLLSLIRSHLFIFSFIFFTLRWIPKNIYCYDLCQGVFCLCFPWGIL